LETVTGGGDSCNCAPTNPNRALVENGRIARSGMDSPIL
jgi:hypothetical protein